MEKIYDVLVVGGGPAGMSAALYALRNGKSVLTVEKEVFGGQIVNSPKVENIPGFKEIAGDAFGDLMMEQVQYQGGEIMFDEVLKLEAEGDLLTAYTDMGEEIKARTVILATGTKHRSLGLPNEESLIGKSIHFCAVCDGNFYRNRKVVLIGGGNSAFVEAELLADIVDRLIILQDLPFFTADQKLQDRLQLKNNVEKHCGTKVLEYVVNEGKLTGVKYLENEEEKIAECDGVFLAVGLIPDNKNFTNVAALDERGYFVADEYGTTGTENVFVAGDCRTKSLRQVATACSDGANAAIKACEYLNR
jgi:thioredoxin reductase (NADPH)